MLALFREGMKGSAPLLKHLKGSQRMIHMILTRRKRSNAKPNPESTWNTCNLYFNCAHHLEDPFDREAIKLHGLLHAVPLLLHFPASKVCLQRLDVSRNEDQHVGIK